MLKKILAPFASLKLAITLLAMSIVLVYAGTWAQVDSGIWTVQKIYFHSFYCWIDFKTLLPRAQPGQWSMPGGFPFPGGYTLGALMLVNLLAAHIVRFKFNWKRSGVILIHLGLILLILGELLTSLLATEGQMTIDEGSTAIYSQDTRNAELVVMDSSASPDTDLVVSFPQSMVKPGATLSHSLFPFEIKVDEFFPNSEILGPMQAPPGAKGKATAGFGKGIILESLPPIAGTEAMTSDKPSAYVTLSASGHPLGTYLLSTILEGAQELHLGDKTFLLALRPKRQYKPYAMTLLKFSHDKYLGTGMDRNFSSRIRLTDAIHDVDREVLIRMNEPLRYGGETYYQASFKPDDKTTILQVVHNPAWTMPYIACVVGALGMLIHFGIMLVGSVSKRSERRENLLTQARLLHPGEFNEGERPLSIPGKLMPYLLGLVGVSLAVGMYIKASATAAPGEFDYQAFGNLPVSFDGRVLPMDTLARTTLAVTMGRESTKIGSEGPNSDEWSKVPYDQWKSVPAIHWLLDNLAFNGKTNDYRIFRIDNPELLGLLALDQDRSPRLYSFKEVIAKEQSLSEQMSRISQIEAGKRGPFERKLAELYQHLMLYVKIASVGELYLVPPVETGEQWQKIGPFLPTKTTTNPTQTPASDLLLTILSDYQTGNVLEFNKHTADYHRLLESRLPTDLQKSEFEAFFNRFDPFLQSQILYVMVFMLGCCSWLGWARPLGRAALVLLVITLGLHTFGLASRIYISGRPPVTNLYSSAVFIAWAGVVLAIGLELYFRNVIAMVCASAMGFLSLLIAHHLAGDGDTMKQLAAVLDTNGWLATHVVCITLGYSATFLAGVLAVAYILLGLFTPILTTSKPGRLDEDAPAKLLPRMVYAILCFAILFSFVGTILGGIWADQSWGRFWGWDPKENGAVLIVLWNALILHARWSGIAKRRGVMLLAVFGNIITSWSWFGTNMLGVGLHSYGFMEKALFWLLVFVVSQLLIIALGNIPLRFWKSFENEATNPNAPTTGRTTGLAASAASRAPN